MVEPRGAEIYVGGPKDSVVTEHRAADRRRSELSELARVSKPPFGDGAVKKTEKHVRRCTTSLFSAP